MGFLSLSFQESSNSSCSTRRETLGEESSVWPRLWLHQTFSQAPPTYLKQEEKHLSEALTVVTKHKEKWRQCGTFEGILRFFPFCSWMVRSELHVEESVTVLIIVLNFWHCRLLGYKTAETLVFEPPSLSDGRPRSKSSRDSFTSFIWNSQTAQSEEGGQTAVVLQEPAFYNAYIPY